MAADILTQDDVSVLIDTDRDDQMEHLQQALGSKYHLMEYVSRGAMGAVFVARESGLHRSVGIKVISSDPGTARTADQDTRFSAEMKAMASISDPNVIRIYGQGGDPSKGEPRYIVMEYLTGMSLEHYIADRGVVETSLVDSGGERRTLRALNWTQTLPLIRQITQGLKAIHAAKILHRDLKPGNVVIDLDRARRERAVIIDFGLAKLSPDQAVQGEWTVINLPNTQAGQLFGTPQYMPPEQAMGKLIQSTDFWVDTYALGCILYEMLTGFVPYTDKLLLELTEQELNSNVMAWLGIHPRGLELLPISKVQPSVPAWLDAFMAKALDRSPAQRFQTAEEFLRALDDAIEQEEHERERQRQARAARRHLWPFIVGIPVFVFVLVGMALWLFGIRQPSPILDAGSEHLRPVVLVDAGADASLSITADVGTVSDGGVDAGLVGGSPADAGVRRRGVRRSTHRCVEQLNPVTGTITPCFGRR